MKAIECFQTALTLDPVHERALCNLACQLELLGDSTSSLKCFQIALQCHPESALARFGVGTTQLALGNFTEGWRNYEARWRTPSFRRERRTFAQPQWMGEDIRGARIFVHCEQGLGDTMQFARYIPMLASLGATVYFEVQPQLHRLLRNMEGATQVLLRGMELPDFDLHSPLLSLPLGFRTELENIPAAVPYLRPTEVAVRSWSARLDPNCFRVGVVWSGNPKHSRELHRSIAIEKLAQLGRIPGVVLYSLQKGATASQADGLRAETGLVNLDNQQIDFADTAAIVANLDLVITIDTSVAHLAGAMGKPVWILLHSVPDWRWLRGRDDSPWYPTARLFRQRVAGEWNDVLERMGSELRNLVNASNAGRSAASVFDSISSSSEPGATSANTLGI